MKFRAGDIVNNGNNDVWCVIEYKYGVIMVKPINVLDITIYGKIDDNYPFTEDTFNLNIDYMKKIEWNKQLACIINENDIENINKE